MPSKRTLEWRTRQQQYIKEWQEKMSDMRLKAATERWDQDKFEMEIVQLLPHQKLRDVFVYAKNYIARHKSGKFRTLMFEVYDEIVKHGTVEPSRL
ncbi:MAG: hypothetical protein AAB309_07600, partial [Deltaproteobacteria bacterium]